MDCYCPRQDHKSDFLSAINNTYPHSKIQSSHRSKQRQAYHQQIYANSCPQLNHYHNHHNRTYKDLPSNMQMSVNCECLTNFNRYNRICLPWQDWQSAHTNRVRNLDNIINLSNDKYLCKNCCFNDQPIVWWVSCPRLSASQPVLPTYTNVNTTMPGNMCEYHNYNQQVQQPKQYKRVGGCNHNSRSITNMPNYLNYNQCNCESQHTGFNGIASIPPPPLQSILGHTNHNSVNNRSLRCCVHTNGGGFNENDTSASGKFYILYYIWTKNYQL